MLGIGNNHKSVVHEYRYHKKKQFRKFTYFCKDNSELIKGVFGNFLQEDSIRFCDCPKIIIMKTYRILTLQNIQKDCEHPQLASIELDLSSLL
ncbi:MAG: hypothetical protein CMK30_04825 [Porticoccaceae bacterium]|nr:hypothetical protein [Porticoccaceae bacterium]